MLNLLWVVAIILLIMWLFGFLITPLSFAFMGGFVHVLLVIGLILLIIWLVQRVSYHSHSNH